MTIMQALLGVPKAAPSTFAFSATISANTTNYNLRAAAVTAGWNQTSPLNATVTINAGVYVSSTNTGTYAFDTGSTFPAGTTLALINNGTILGMGGRGSDSCATGSDASYQQPTTIASVGGPGLIARYAISITNNGIISGGGGGGGGGWAQLG
jgi:hypothetical protein